MPSAFFTSSSSTSTFLSVPVDLSKARGSAEQLGEVRAAIETATTACGVRVRKSGDGSPRSRVSSPSAWLLQWRNINLIGEKLEWEVALEDETVIKFSPQDVATFLSWGNNYGECVLTNPAHLNTI